MVNAPGSGTSAVGWFTLALINAGIAQGKGRSGLNWWLLSIFLGPIATLLVVVLDPVAAHSQARAGEGAERTR